MIIYFNQKYEFTVSTFKKLEVISFEEKVYFDDVVLIKASNDDFVEKVYVRSGDFVQKGSLLIKLENDEEEFLLSKAKNEYAMAVLNSGPAIQEEKKKAINLAEKRVLNTELKSPVTGYILNIEMRDNMFVEKGNPLINIVGKNSFPYIKIAGAIEKSIKDAEYISMEIKPDGIKLLVEKNGLCQKNEEYILKISLSITELNKKNLDFLYGNVEIKYYSDSLAWIPADFVNNSTIRVKDGIYKQVELIQTKDDLVLVKGLTTGDILTTKR
jgi:biotin carboxyl carrier protein